MKRNNKVLGKGLNALIDNNITVKKADDKNGLIELNIKNIIPDKHQPRKDIKDIEKLAVSIKEYGVIQPIVVLKKDNQYQIIAGERRWRASKLAGLTNIPAIIKDTMSDKDKLEISLIENLQRKNLNPIEEGEAYQELIEKFNLKADYLAKIFGKDRSTITNTIRLLSLPAIIKNDLKNGIIQAGHARPLINVNDLTIILAIRERIIKDKISVREVEKLIKQSKAKPSVKKKKKDAIESNLSSIEDKFREIFSTKVKIAGNNNKGKIILEYYTQDDLERILEVLNIN